MRTLSAALEAHLALSVTTLATLWKVTRADGLIYGFTDHDEDLVIAGVTYKASTGYARSAVRATLGFTPDNLELSGALASSAITAADIRAGLWDYAVVEIFYCNWADLTQGVGKLSKGKLGAIKDGRNGFVSELLGLSSHLGQAIGRVYSPACDANLGDARCTVSLAPFTKAGAVTAVTSKRAFADAARAEANGYFDGGKLTWLTGNNAGLKMEVKTFLLAGGAFTLQLPMPFAVQVGDTYSAIHGCDKTPATCIATFANIVNFRGFPNVPGPRRLVSGGL
jgi:uncharacterized phage protein (TIGR02218 family)